jgi:hypothetical protein
MSWPAPSKLIGPASSVLPAVQERLVPLTLAQPGFRHLYTGRDEAHPDRLVAVPIFTNRDTATAAHAQEVALMAQHRDVWLSPTRIILAGEVLVSAIARAIPIRPGNPYDGLRRTRHWRNKVLKPSQAAEWPTQPRQCARR